MGSTAQGDRSSKFGHLFGFGMGKASQDDVNDIKNSLGSESTARTALSALQSILTKRLQSMLGQEVSNHPQAATALQVLHQAKQDPGMHVPKEVRDAMRKDIDSNQIKPTLDIADFEKKQEILDDLIKVSSDQAQDLLSVITASRRGIETLERKLALNQEEIHTAEIEIDLLEDEEGESDSGGPSANTRAATAASEESKTESETQAALAQKRKELQALKAKKEELNDKLLKHLKVKTDASASLAKAAGGDGALNKSFTTYRSDLINANIECKSFLVDLLRRTDTHVGTNLADSMETPSSEQRTDTEKALNIFGTAEQLARATEQATAIMKESSYEAVEAARKQALSSFQTTHGQALDVDAGLRNFDKNIKLFQNAGGDASDNNKNEMLRLSLAASGKFGSQKLATKVHEIILGKAEEKEPLSHGALVEQVQQFARIYKTTAEASRATRERNKGKPKVTKESVPKNDPTALNVTDKESRNKTSTGKGSSKGGGKGDRKPTSKGKGKGGKDTQQRTNGYQRGQGVQCSNCGGRGHYSNQCPTEQSGQSNKGCWNCGEQDHIQKNCPNQRQWQPRSQQNQQGSQQRQQRNHRGKGQFGSSNSVQDRNSDGSTDESSRVSVAEFKEMNKKLNQITDVLSQLVQNDEVDGVEDP